MAGLELKLLGGLSVRQEGKTLASLRSKKGQALLVYLAMSGQAHSRLALAGLFWPDKPEADALRNLRKGLHLLNRDLGPYLHITRESVALSDETTVLVDALTFESAAQTTPSSLANLEAAGDLYGGPFLEGFYLSDCPEFEGWMIGRRETLHSLALDSFWRITGERRKRGDYARAEQSARRQIVLDNLDERGHRDLMEALALQGRRAEALQQFESCRHILEAELGVEPAPSTLRLAERIRLNQLTAPTIQEPSEAEPPVERGGPDTQAGLPVVAPLIGRENELTTLRNYLGSSVGRIVTIVGPGGIGKTTLAVTVARQESERYVDGVGYISLAAIQADDASSPSSAKNAIIRAITAALGYALQQGGRSHTQQLRDLLAGQQRLLVLDNFEQVVAGASVVAELTQAAPRLTILVTSREPLGLYGEQLLPLNGLAFDPSAVSEDDAAAQLFLQRVRQRDPTFMLGDSERPYLTQICQMVGGSPLALELAAANMEGISLSRMAEELTHSLDLLSTNWSDRPERHRSIRSVFEASWRSLTSEEQRVLSCLSVFREGFDVDAAQTVSAPRLTVQAYRRVLAGLIHKSLLGYDRAADRYSMHELLRQFAAEKPALALDDQAEANQRHCDYFTTLLAQQERKWNTASEEEALNTLLIDEANIGRAWRWAMEHHQWSRLVAAFYSWQSFYRWRIAIAEFNELCGAILEQTRRVTVGQSVEVLQLRARAMGALLWSEPDKRKAARMVEDMHGLLDDLERRGVDVAEERALLLRDSAILIGQLGGPTRAAEQLERSKALFDAKGMLWDAAMVEGNLALIDWRHGRHAEAVRRQERVLATAQHLGSKRSEGAAAFNLGLFLRSLGEFDRAAELQQAALDEGRRLNYGLALTRYAAGLARTQLWRGQSEEARRRASEGLNAAQASHFPQYVAWARGYLAETQIHGGQYR